jgi:hypothetical protein
VRVTTPGHTPELAAVGDAGVVSLRRPLVTRSVRLDVVRETEPVGPESGRLLSAVSIGEIRIPGLGAPRPRRTGTFRSECGALRAVGRQAFADLAVSGTVADLDAGRPLPMRACGRSDRLQLDAGETVIDAPPGPLFRADYLRLSSPAPVPLPNAASGGAGRVIDQGSAGEGSRDGAKLAVAAPGWLVLGESYSSGWRATCTDRSGNEHELGAPVPIDGFANGWRAVPGCMAASFAFAPQATADVSYLVSLLAFLAMLAVVLLAWWRGRRRGRRRRRRRGDGVALWGEPPVVPARRYGLRFAIPVALAVGLVGGYVFAWRAAPPLALGTAALMVVGVTVGRLLLLALYGLAVVPILYLVNPLPNLGGANFGYAQHYIGAHWVAVGVVCALLWALVLWLRELRNPPPVSSDAAHGPP